MSYRKVPEEFSHKQKPRLDERIYIRCLLITVVSTVVVYLIVIIFSGTELCSISEFSEFPEADTTGLQKYSIPVDVYLAGSRWHKVNMKDEDVQYIFEEVNNIWSKYGIEFYINNFSVNNNLPDSMVYWNFIAFSNNHINAAKRLGERVGRCKFYTDEDKIIDIFIVKDFFLNWMEGFRIDGTPANAAIIRQDSQNLPWVFAHELGHILNNNHSNTTLMTNEPCVKQLYYPTTLSELELERVLSFIESDSIKSEKIVE